MGSARTKKALETFDMAEMLRGIPSGNHFNACRRGNAAGTHNRNIRKMSRRKDRMDEMNARFGIYADD